MTVDCSMMGMNMEVSRFSFPRLRDQSGRAPFLALAVWTLDSGRSPPGGWRLGCHLLPPMKSASKISQTAPSLHLLKSVLSHAWGIHPSLGFAPLSFLLKKGSIRLLPLQPPLSPRRRI
jgi:hypothetical protein